MHGSTYRRDVAALGLMATALLSVGSVLLQPDLAGSPAQRLAAIDAAGARGQVSAAAFVLAQLPAIAGLLGVAHLLRERAPRLSSVGGTLAVLGAFGHSVFGGVMLVETVMAGRGNDRGAYAALVGQVESSPVMVFALLGLAGTVLGVLVLALGLWRSHVVPGWVPALLGLWVVVEFVGTGVSALAEPLSAAMYLVACVALARFLHRTSPMTWSPAYDAAPAADRAVDAARPLA